MTTHNHARLATIRAHVKRISSELDYANRRMLDIRTGAQFIKGQEKPRRRRARRPAVPAH